MNKLFRGLFAGVMLASMGFVSSAFGEAAWTVEGYTVADWTNPANRLMPDTSAGSISDGNILSYNACSDSQLTVQWNTPKDISSIHVYTMDNGGGNGAWSWKVAITNVQILYEGASDFVSLTDSGITHDGSIEGGSGGMGKHLTLSGSDEYFLTRVRGIRLLSGQWGCWWAHGCGELVVFGEDSVAESLTAEYLAAAGQYSAKASVVAADFPVDVYFCRGATDGGTTIGDWDKVTKAGTLGSTNDVCEVSGDTDFAHCRFYFQSSRYDETVWSEGLTVSDNPVVATVIGERHTDSAAVIASVRSPGASSSSCDVYFAYALAGEELPELKLVKSGVAVGEAVTNVVTGLSAGLTYDYKFVVRNAQSGETEVAGTWVTLPAGSWTLTAFDSLSDYVFPENWLPCEGSSGRVSISPSSTAAGGVIGGKAIFTSPKDITRFDIYTYNSGRRCMALANVQVKYYGAEDYVELPGTSLDYRTDVGKEGIKFSFLSTEVGGLTNVVGIKVKITEAQSGGVNLAGLDVIGYPSDYTGEYKWDYNFVDGVNFTRPADLITDATTSGISANESDGDITTTTERGKNYSGYVWNFDKPHDITSVGLFSNSSSGPNYNYSVSSIQIKRKGDADYTSLPGVAFDWFQRGSNILSCVLRPTKKYVARNITSLKVSLGDKSCNWVNTYMAEVYVSGRRTPPGIMLLVR